MHHSAAGWGEGETGGLVWAQGGWAGIQGGLALGQGGKVLAFFLLRRARP